jgi:catechol 2,3-dioxygenase-like lactoylglutathione lyase family enzyme
MSTIVICIDVDNSDRAVHFYRDGLGLTLVASGPGWAKMTLGDQIFVIGIPWGLDGPIPHDYQRHWTPLHLDFLVGDFDAAVELAIKAGATLDRPILRRGERGDMANLSDPSGNGFDLIKKSQ